MNKFLLTALVLALSLAAHSAQILPAVVEISEIHATTDLLARNMLRDLHQKYLTLLTAFAVSYGDVLDTPNPPTNFDDASIKAWQKKFELDFKSSQSSQKLIALKDLAASNGFRLTIYSPKIWHHLFQSVIHGNNLFSILVDEQGTLQSFVEEIAAQNSYSDFQICTWLDNLALFIDLNTDVNAEDFLKHARNSVFFSAVQLTQEDKTIYEYLKQRLPAFFIDDEFPEITVPKRNLHKKERDEFQYVLSRLKLIGQNSGLKSYCNFNVKQDKAFLDALKQAGFKDQIGNYTFTHFSGLGFRLFEWRILEGGISTRNDRQKMLDNFANKRYEMSAYLTYRSNDDLSEPGTGESVRLIHEEILATLGRISPQLIEAKVKQFSKENIAYDLEIVERIKTGEIWNQIFEKRRLLEPSLFIDEQPLLKNKRKNVGERELLPKLTEAPKKKSKLRAISKNISRTLTPTMQANEKTPVVSTQPSIAVSPLEPVKKKRKRTRRKNHQGQLARPAQVPANLLQQGFALEAIDLPSDQQIISEVLKQQKMDAKKLALGTRDEKLSSVISSTKPRKVARCGGFTLTKSPRSFFAKARDVLMLKKPTLGNYFPQSWQATFMHAANDLITKQFARPTAADLPKQQRYVGAAEKLQIEYLGKQLDLDEENLTRFAADIDGPQSDLLITNFNQYMDECMKLAVQWREFHPDLPNPLLHLNELIVSGKLLLLEIERLKNHKESLLSRIQEAEENISILKEMFDNPDQKYFVEDIYQAYSLLPSLTQNHDPSDAFETHYVMIKLKHIVCHLEAWKQSTLQWFTTSHEVIDEDLRALDTCYDEEDSENDDNSIYGS